FGATFAFIIAGPRSYRVDVPPVVFALRVHVRISVNFRSRCLENFRLNSLRQAQHVNGTMYAGLGRLDGIVLIVHGRCWASQIVDLIDLKIDWKCDVMPNQFETLLSKQVFYIVTRTGKKVIETNYVRAQG